MIRNVSKKSLFLSVIPDLIRNPESKSLGSHVRENDKSEKLFPLRALRAFVVNSFRLPSFFLTPHPSPLPKGTMCKSGFASGLSLIEILIAIGILAVTMMLIAAAFPAGVAMSIAVSDETTAGAVFQDALSIIRDNYSVSEITDWLISNPTDPPLPGTTDYSLISNLYLGQDSGSYDADEGLS